MIVSSEVYRQIPAQTRMKASGIQTLGALGTANFPGTDGRQLRRQFIVTNLSSTDLLENVILYICTAAGKYFAACYPQTCMTFETSEDIQLYNRSGSKTLDYIVGELFYLESDFATNSVVPTFAQGGTNRGGPSRAGLL